MHRRHWHLRPGGDRSESPGPCVLRLLARDDPGSADYVQLPALHRVLSPALPIQRVVYRYKWASIYLPSCSVHICYFHWSIRLCSASRSTKKYFHLADLISGMYLAAHYAGQTWGMVASFTYLGGVQFRRSSGRRYARFFSCSWPGTSRSPTTWCRNTHCSYRAEAVFGYPFRGHHALRPRRDGGRDCGLRSHGLPDQTSATALGVGTYPPSLLWVSGLYPRLCGLLLLQVCHALQYLIFPLRVGNESQPR